MQILVPEAGEFSFSLFLHDSETNVFAIAKNLYMNEVSMDVVAFHGVNILYWWFIDNLEKSLTNRVANSFLILLIDCKSTTYGLKPLMLNRQLCVSIGLSLTTHLIEKFHFPINDIINCLRFWFPCHVPFFKALLLL